MQVDTFLGAKIVKEGGLVVFPTETVYGLGANALFDGSVKKIFLVKNRPFDNPLIIHTHSQELIKKYVLEITDIHYALSEFWPGPISIIYKKNNKISDFVSCNLKTLAFRIPSNKTALSFLKECNIPVAAPSANISSRPSSTSFDMASFELFLKVDGIINDEDSEFGLESTVVSIQDNFVNILRLGFVTKEMIEKKLEKYNIKAKVKIIKEKNLSPSSPGTKYPHYKPNCKVDLLEDDVKEYKKDTAYIILGDAVKKSNIVSFEDNTEYAKNLYKTLIYFERNGFKKIILQKPYQDSIGEIILEKLEKILQS